MSLRYVVLALLEHEPLTGYEMVKSFDRAVGYFWSASHQQVYRELGGLAERDWVRFDRQTQSDRPDKKVYSITTTGHAELMAWVDKPLPPRAEKEPVLVKLLAGPVAPIASLRAELDRQREQTEARLAAYRAIESFDYSPAPDARAPIDRDFMLYIALRRGILAAESYLDWISETLALLADRQAS
ncbi:PadR family transcriptional regulator [Salinisphaera aquimarina]|uniref:PadR family transcriptional regulator n=1 Tax=Salinisphaera aquimarina TaxID=2094031 RepID=A0ABV7EKA1_9GAMM